MCKNVFLRRTWAEIDLNQISKNIGTYISSRNRMTQVMAVVKADAYGHGDVKVALFLQQSGINMFAVSNICEAIALREAGIKGDILVLGYTPVESIALLYKYDITQTLISYEYAQKLCEYTPERLKCHIAVDTGMNRIGFDASNLELCIEQVEKCASFFDIDGIFTHLCVADGVHEEDKIFTCSQIELFKKVVCGTKHLNIKHAHCLNSAGGLSYEKVDDDLGKIVRLGIVMYGLKPSLEFEMPEEIKPALSWKTVIAMIKDIDPGESVGYGRSFISDKKMKIATLPVGYADGYNRLLSNKGYVLIRGKKAPIIGRICMDQMMVDISDIEIPTIGDEVVLIGESGDEIITADDMASLANTIGYEIVCDISKRVPRVYIE